MTQSTKGNEMTNNELAEHMEKVRDLCLHCGDVARSKQLDCFTEAARRLRELPDPAPSEPEYGWANLSRDLGIAMAISSLRNEELQIAGVVGTCVRLMREKGWDTTRVRNPEQNRWTWATSNSQRPETVMGSCGPAPSEPAAWRDMLKHAGVIQ
jgi:hypothetical protein